MKQAFRWSYAAALFVLFVGAAATVDAQTTPDPFVAQITNSPDASFATDMSGNGRLVVIESNGDISTEKTAARNNADRNREIFLVDYAQRRIFQITNTTSARVDTTKPALDPTKPIDGLIDFSNIKVEVTNNRPSLSNNGRWIAFSSNASTPDNFDGDANSAALVADGNQEMFLYFVPATPAVVLSNGADPAFVDLTAAGGGTFTQITNTTASHVPTPGRAATTTVAGAAPTVAFDNRDAAVNDNASVVAFVSTRDLVATGNQDANPEIFIYRRTPSATITQLTATGGTAPNFDFNENPSISGSGSVIAFISNANITAGTSAGNADKNGEVYLGTFDATTSTAAVTRQVTSTTSPFVGIGVNFFSPGRRLSRDGNLVVMESLADLSGNSAIQSNTTVFVYNVSANTFTQIGPRADNRSDFRFPTFTDYTGLAPATVIFATGLNFKADGTAATPATDGLNPNGQMQIFMAPVTAPITFTRLTNNPIQLFPPGPLIQPLASNTRDRIAFSLFVTELGGLNTDGFSEAYYLLSRQGTDAAGATLSFFTGASERSVVTPSPTPPAVQGLAPGMLAIVRSATALAPSSQAASSASEAARRPPLPIELNGVSISINNAAAGLYFVSSGQINFVVPPGLAATTGTNTYPVVINNNGTTIRGTIQILPAQPDIFIETNGFGSNRASVLNVTNPLTAGSPEPFTVTTTYLNSSAQVVTEATKLRIFLTGVRRVTDKAQITVRIGTTDLTGDAIVQVLPSDLPGTDQIDVTLPATLAGAGDVPVIITVVKDGVTTSSHAADSAPRIRIN